MMEIEMRGKLWTWKGFESGSDKYFTLNSTRSVWNGNLGEVTWKWNGSLPLHTQMISLNKIISMRICWKLEKVVHMSITFTHLLRKQSKIKIREPHTTLSILLSHWFPFHLSRNRSLRLFFVLLSSLVEIIVYFNIYFVIHILHPKKHRPVSFEITPDVCVLRPCKNRTESMYYALTYCIFAGELRISETGIEFLPTFFSCLYYYYYL